MRTVQSRQRLREYVGDVTRSLTAVVDAMEQAFGHMERIGGPTRVYEVVGENQHGAIYAMDSNPSAAIGFGWSGDDMLVDTIYWWDRFDFKSPNYSLDLPKGVDVEKLLPAIKHAIATKQSGEIEI